MISVGLTSLTNNYIIMSYCVHWPIFIDVLLDLNALFATIVTRQIWLDDEKVIEQVPLSQLSEPTTISSTTIPELSSRNTV